MKISILFFGLIVCGLIGYWYLRNAEIPLLHDVFLEGKWYALEVAQNDEARQRGLGERDHLCEQCAILFVFDAPGQYGFWMRGMRFPLDIIWLRDDTVVWVERRIASESSTIYRPSVSANRVLELNAGAGDSVQLGDQMRFR